ncbi:MAG: hypothetical protein GWN01_13200, partial [Nitrosopumilaceae archaeon]|nr:hypothetical protein [Nitrosopumilaceae archaeon]NIU88233.1 hypothetical protein [Nitrosopumilaceae archaeon]NIX62422.1 hypothetical protein [Nitrosopumilaceae archaeon]
LSASGVFIDIDGVLRTGSEPYDIGSDEITQLTLTTVPTVSLGGFMQSTADGPVSGFIGGYLGARGIIVPQADVGGFLKGKALPGFNRIALMGGYLEGTGGVKGPDSIGGYLFAIPLTTVPNKIVGGYASGAFEQSANLGGFTFGRPKFKTFAELHARTLVKVRSEDVVDQGLNLDAKTIFKQVDNQEFNAKFIWFAESAADFNAKLKVEKYKEVPNVQILSVTPASGGLKE